MLFIHRTLPHHCNCYVQGNQNGINTTKLNSSDYLNLVWLNLTNQCHTTLSLILQLQYFRLIWCALCICEAYLSAPCQPRVIKWLSSPISFCLEIVFQWFCLESTGLLQAVNDCNKKGRFEGTRLIISWFTTLFLDQKWK